MEQKFLCKQMVKNKMKPSEVNSNIIYIKYYRNTYCHKICLVER